MKFVKFLHTPKRRQPGNPVSSIRSFIPIAFLALLASGSAVGAVAVGTTLPQATVAQPYNHILSAAGGSSPYNHIVSSGILPGGISLSASRVLSGTPQNVGLFNFAVQSTDALHVTGVTNSSLRVAGSSGLEITNLTLPAGRLGTMYDVALAAQGGASPCAWDLILNGGSIPPGLTFSSSVRILGTPTSGGIYPIIARVSDANGNSFQSALTLRIDSAQFSILTNSLATASANVKYSQGIAAIGGTAPYASQLHPRLKREWAWCNSQSGRDFEFRTESRRKIEDDQPIHYGCWPDESRLATGADHCNHGPSGYDANRDSKWSGSGNSICRERSRHDSRPRSDQSSYSFWSQLRMNTIQLTVGSTGSTGNVTVFVKS